MKPGDHPEFFRLPPPPGASRESTLRLDREGCFWHDGARVERPALVKALHRWLDVHPDDGRYILTNGYDWCYLEVEDTPCFVELLRGDPPARPTAVLADGSEEPLDVESLVADGAGHCFVRAKSGTRWARLSRHAQHQLGPFLAEDEPLRMRVEGREHVIGARPTSADATDRASGPRASQ